MDILFIILAFLIFVALIAVGVFVMMSWAINITDKSEDKDWQ